MTFTEQDLRDTLRADAGTEPLATDAGWTDVTRRRARARRDRRLILAAAAVMVVAVATTTTVVVLAHDDEGVQLTPPPVTTPSTTAATPTTVPPGILEEPAIAGCSASRWPLPGNSPAEIDEFATLGTPEATAAFVAAKATTCDYDALRTVMADDFTWSHDQPGGADRALEAWRLTEANGQPSMYGIVALLRTGQREYDPATGITTWNYAGVSPDISYGIEIDDSGIWRSYAAL